MRKLLIILLFIFIPSVALGQQSLTTTFASDSSLAGPNAGIFFDIENVSRAPITILSWDVNIANFSPIIPPTACDAPANISVYTRSGTSQGFEGTQDGWTLVGTETGIVCAGNNMPTPLSIGGFMIRSGETIGIAMVIENSDDRWRYTFGDQVFNNGDLEIRPGSSYLTAFESPPANCGAVPCFYTPRVWNGTVYYSFVLTSNIPTLSEWGLIAMAGILGIVGFMVIRRRKVAA